MAPSIRKRIFIFGTNFYQRKTVCFDHKLPINFWIRYESLRLKKLNGNIDSFGTLRRIGLHLARKTEQTDPDSSEWLNVIIGRAWMSVIETKSFSTRFSEKIVRKLESVKRPSFLVRVFGQYG